MVGRLSSRGQRPCGTPGKQVHAGTESIHGPFVSAGGLPVPVLVSIHHPVFSTVLPLQCVKVEKGCEVKEVTMPCDPVWVLVCCPFFPVSVVASWSCSPCRAVCRHAAPGPTEPLGASPPVHGALGYQLGFTCSELSVGDSHTYMENYPQISLLYWCLFKPFIFIYLFIYLHIFIFISMVFGV